MCEATTGRIVAIKYRRIGVWLSGLSGESWMAVLGTEATLGLRPISSVTLYRIAQYKIPLAFNALYFPYSETTHLFGVNSTD